MRRLLAKLGLFSIVWSQGTTKGNRKRESFAGWRIVRYDKEKNRFFIWLSRCIDHKLYLDNLPQRNNFYYWSPDRPKPCTCCEVHGGVKK